MRQRKYVYGRTREVVHEKWLNLQHQARRGPVATRVPRLGQYLDRWLSDVIVPSLAPATSTNYGMFVRLYITPKLGNRRLDKLTVREVQTWFTKLKGECQCCAQGKDAARLDPRCCAVGQCCHQVPSEWTAHQALRVLRSALGNAVRDELVTRNVAALVRVSLPRPRRGSRWSVDEARAFLESARADDDPCYVAYVLILVLGLRRGEALGLAWAEVDTEAAEAFIACQVQRVGGQLVRRRTKTASSDAPLPLPTLCTAALARHRVRQQRWAEKAGEAWHEHDLVVTTRYGEPVDPRNFHRAFKARSARAGVPEITVHAARRTCASLLVAMDVHPRVAMQILRRSQIAVTMSFYSEVSTEDTRQARRRLGERLSGEAS